MPAESSPMPGLTFHMLDDRKFIQYMAHAKAYATTAGFESVCEAMYLNKPVLMVPSHIEQACNAHDVFLCGAGVVCDRFDLDQLLTLAEQPRQNIQFRNWVQQAEWIFVREFRPDLVLEEEGTGFFLRNLATSYIYKMARYISL